VVATRESSLAGVHVGTSGWSYPSWKPGFYPAGTDAKQFLSFYAQRFSTVELNTTGYRLPAEEQFTRWAQQTRRDSRSHPSWQATGRGSWRSSRPVSACSAIGSGRLASS